MLWTNSSANGTDDGDDGDVVLVESSSLMRVLIRLVGQPISTNALAKLAVLVVVVELLAVVVAFLLVVGCLGWEIRTRPPIDVQ